MPKREKKINLLLRRRRAIQVQARDMEEFVEGNLNDLTIASLEARLPLLERMFDQFCEVQDEIEMLDEAEIERNVRNLYVTAYCDLKARLQSRIDEIKAVTAQPAGNNARSSTVKLPRLNLCKFSGKSSEWLEFTSSFNSTIDTNPDLSKIEKFQYLRSCLSGEALKTIQSFDMTEESYEEAKRVLKARYDNIRWIMNSHISEIFHASQASDGSPARLRALSDAITSHLRPFQP